MNKDFNALNLMNSRQKDIIQAFNQTQATFPDQATLASIFYEQAMKHGSQTAISLKSEKITYDELNRQSNQVASLLCQIGIQPGHVVMIFMDRGIEAYVAILGILKAGAAYLPVDPANPQERVQYILTNSNVHSVLTKSRFLSKTEGQGANFIVTFDELKQFQKAKKRGGKVFDRDNIVLCPDVNLSLKNNATDLAYIIYTSGSTGAPKGVMVEHRSVVNLAYWAQKTFGLTQQSHITQNYSIAFDASVQEIFSAWASGATLYPIPEDIQLNPSLFIPWLRENAISYWDTIPSLWYQIVHFVATQSSEKRIALPNLEVLVLGGEVLHADKIKDWMTFVNHVHRIYNVYGPTEATVTTTCYLISPDDNQSSVAIGQPVHNAEVYILGEDLHQCMPITANNKIDKSVLLQFANGDNLRQNEIYQEPTTKTEKLLANIWREVLHIEKISIYDNFFAVGGDSILSIMIRHRCELEGIRLKTIDLFKYSTIKTLARYIDEHLPELQFSNTDSPTQNKPVIVLSSEQQKLLPPNASVVLPLLPLQYGMLYESAAYHHAIYVPQRLHHCEGTIDINAFERAINALIERHEAFRTIFRADIASQPVQIVLSNVHYQLPYKDLSDRAWQEQDAYIEQEAKKEREQGFNLGQWPLFQFTVYKRSETKFDILWTTHHIIIDGWSTSIFYKELSQVYSALVTQKFRPLPRQKSNFSDYLMHHLNQDFTGARAFWQRYLTDMVPIELPRDSPSEGEWGQVKEVMVSLDEEHTACLQKLARQNNATLNTVCLAAYFLLLRTICQQDDLTIGIVTSARSEGVDEVINVVGNLINTIPFRVNTSEADTVEEIISLVKKSLFEAQAYEFLGLADITALIRRGINRSLIQTLFVFENYPTLADLGGTESFSTFEVLNVVGNESNGFPLTVVSYINSENCLAFRFEYATGLFGRDTISAWARIYLTICERFGQADQ